MPPAHPRAADDPEAIRRAGPDVLSLALIDARNHLLHRLAADESPTALRLAAHAGGYQERWISRHPQRQRGEACDPCGPRLAGIEPALEGWLAAAGEPPAPQALRSYLAETLETTLDLLAASADGDEALCFYRLALLHEDRLCEALAERLRPPGPPARAAHAALPVWMPAQRWALGSPRGVWAPYNERWSHEVAVPEFEIDARPVHWAAYAEFAEDGGYDSRALWTDAGWGWLQASGRRAPRHVEQLQGGVLVMRGVGAAARLVRAPSAQPALHVNRHEAAAWCRWAGRRLPTEPEWEIAAHTAAGRGWQWGDVFEWVAGSARSWPGAGDPPPGTLDAVPPPGADGQPAGVLRGASFATRTRWAHPKARRFAAPERDTMFCGFRSCAL